MTISAEAPIGVIAHYNLLERLEPSGPGELYRARDTHKGRTVVIRLLPAGQPAADRAAVVEAARALGTLTHPNVVTVFDAGEHDARAYVAFEFLNGQTLRAELGGRPMNVRRAATLATQIAGAVADIHAAGAQPAAISPDAIVVTAKGLAKVPVFDLGSKDGFDAAGGGARLIDYRSPEEEQGAPGDERSDVHSTGAVLFELLTARRPSPRGAAAPSASNTLVPRELDEVVLKAVAPNPERRYQSAAVFAAELRRATTSEPHASTSAEVPEVPAANVGRVLLFAALILLAAVGVFWWMR